MVVVGLSCRLAQRALKELYPADPLERECERRFPEALGETVWPEFFREVTRLYPWVGAPPAEASPPELNTSDYDRLKCANSPDG